MIMKALLRPNSHSLLPPAYPTYEHYDVHEYRFNRTDTPHNANYVQMVDDLANLLGDDVHEYWLMFEYGILLIN